LHTGIRYTKIPEPIAGSRDGHGLGTEMKREYLTDNHPCDRTPGRSEEGNENTNENDEYLLTCNVANRNSFADDSDDIFAETHPNTTNEEETATPKPFDSPHTRDSHKHVDSIGNDGDYKGIVNT
jgi:hypothetical protein